MYLTVCIYKAMIEQWKLHYGTKRYFIDENTVIQKGLIVMLFIKGHLEFFKFIGTSSNSVGLTVYNMMLQSVFSQIS